VVGVNAEDAERESGPQSFDDRQHLGGADLLAGGDQGPRGDAIDGMEVIDALERAARRAKHRVAASW